MMCQNWNRCMLCLWSRVFQILCLVQIRGGPPSVYNITDIQMEAADMSLDALIKKDKEEKQQRYKQQHEQRRQKKIHKGGPNTRFPRKERSRERERQPRKLEERLANRNERNDRNDRNERLPPPERFTLLIRGFVADISTEDIYNFLKDRKVLSIKTFLSSEDGKPLQYGKEMPIDVKITFDNKQDADSLMKEYSGKVLDGKRTLEFSFVRG